MAINHQIRVFFSSGRADVELSSQMTDQPGNAVGVTQLYLEPDQGIFLEGLTGSAEVFCSGQRQNKILEPRSVL
jgi:hypothetical protein